MRPPQNAGENLTFYRHEYPGKQASMRPPQNAGENRGEQLSSNDKNAIASMRPPQNAGENRRGWDDAQAER